jgi:hypothetical protein
MGVGRELTSHRLVSLLGNLHCNNPDLLKWAIRRSCLSARGGFHTGDCMDYVDPLDHFAKLWEIGGQCDAALPLADEEL